MPNVDIPVELPTILRNFTLSVLRTKPDDIVDYAVDYFLQLQQQRRSESFNMTTEQHLSSEDPMMNEENRNNNNNISSMIDSNASITINCISPASSPSADGTDSNEEDEKADVLGNDDIMRRHYVKKNEYRRISVAAERYNPEDDHDNDEEETIIYPKTTEQRQRLKEAVGHNLLFRTLESKQIDQILDAMWEKHVQRGESIIQQGDDGDHFYIIDQGTYEVYVSKTLNSAPVKIAEYHDSGSFGELALMYNQPRSATVIAKTDGILWVMGRETFRKLVLKHAFRKRRLYENFLRDLDILQSLTDYERSNVADALIPIDVEKNDVIIKQGDQGDRMFFIEDGQCDIYMSGKFHKRLHKGDYFGELALLNHEPRSATVIAASHRVRLASLEVQSFERLLGPCLDLMQRQTSKYRK